MDDSNYAGCISINVPLLPGMESASCMVCLMITTEEEF